MTELATAFANAFYQLSDDDDASDERHDYVLFLASMGDLELEGFGTVKVSPVELAQGEDGPAIQRDILALDMGDGKTRYIAVVSEWLPREVKWDFSESTVVEVVPQKVMVTSWVGVE